MKKRHIAGRCVVAAAVLFVCTVAGHSRPASAADAKESKAPAFDAIRGLVGTWVSVDPAKEGHKPGTVVFKETSKGSAIVETMMPGGEHEMVNVYFLDGEKIMLTHYCGMGNQPRMSASATVAGPVQFTFIDGGNLKSRNEPHMDSLEITIKGDHLTEKWGMYADGKVTGYHTFEFKKQ